MPGSMIIILTNNMSYDPVVMVEALPINMIQELARRQDGDSSPGSEGQ